MVHKDILQFFWRCEFFAIFCTNRGSSSIGPENVFADSGLPKRSIFFLNDFVQDRLSHNKMHREQEFGLHIEQLLMRGTVKTSKFLIIKILTLFLALTPFLASTMAIASTIKAKFQVNKQLFRMALMQRLMRIPFLSLMTNLSQVDYSTEYGKIGHCMQLLPMILPSKRYS